MSGGGRPPWRAQAPSQSSSTVYGFSPAPAQRLEHPEQQPRRPRPVRTARAEAGAARDHRAPQHALAGVVVHRNPRVPHEPLQPLPVPQQRPQHLPLRVHAGPLGPVPAGLPAQPLPSLQQPLPLLQRPAEQLLHRLFQLLLTSPELRALRFQLQPLLPDFQPLLVAMKHAAEALDPRLRPSLQLRMPRTRPHPVAPHMHPAVHGYHLKLRMLLDERLVGAVAIAQQVHHRLAAQMPQQLRGRRRAAAGQDPHQRRVRGQADPQPVPGLLPAPLRRVTAGVRSVEELHRPGGLVRLHHRRLPLALPDGRLQRLEQVREPPQALRQRRGRDPQPQCLQVPRDRCLRPEQPVDLHQAPGPHTRPQLAAAQPRRRLGDHRPRRGTVAGRLVAQAQDLAQDHVPVDLVQPAGLVPVGHVGGAAARTAAVRRRHVPPLDRLGQLLPRHARRRGRARLSPALPARPLGGAAAGGSSRGGGVSLLRPNSNPRSVASCACKPASRSCDFCKARWLRRSSRCSFSQPAHALAPPAGWGATGWACNRGINLRAAVNRAVCLPLRWQATPPKSSASAVA